MCTLMDRLHSHNAQVTSAAVYSTLAAAGTRERAARTGPETRAHLIWQSRTSPRTPRAPLGPLLARSSQEKLEAPGCVDCGGGQAEQGGSRVAAGNGDADPPDLAAGERTADQARHSGGRCFRFDGPLVASWPGTVEL